MRKSYRNTVCLVALSAVSAHAAVIHVDSSAPAGGDGITWTTAYRFLQDALNDGDPQPGDVTVDEFRCQFVGVKQVRPVPPLASAHLNQTVENPMGLMAVTSGGLGRKHVQVTFDQLAHIDVLDRLDAGVEFDLAADLKPDSLGFDRRSRRLIDHPSADPITDVPVSTNLALELRDTNHRQTSLWH